MFERLFAESGLSLDRLKSLLEVGASGSLVLAARGDAVKQSQFSRQIRELEDFFQIKLVERTGKGIRFTARGKELARISRFFLLGLANFQRGCLSERQEFRIGAGRTFLQRFVVAAASAQNSSVRYVLEEVGDDEIERRLHQLTLDFGIVTASELSRPLQTQSIGSFRIGLWVPDTMREGKKRIANALLKKQLWIAWPSRECVLAKIPLLKDCEPVLICNDFLEAKTVLESGNLATFLPDFLAPGKDSRTIRIPIRELDSPVFHFYLAWNPRLLRLNPHAIQQRDFLAKAAKAVFA